jgi:hypothetical protein
MVLVQKYLTTEDWERLEVEHFRKKEGFALLAAVVPWIMHELPDGQRDDLVAEAGLPMRLLWRATRGGFASRTPVRYALVMSQLVAPPGWPRAVRPPGAPGWEHTAVSWLLDLCPPEFRGYPVLRRHDVVLARFAVLHVEACQAAVRRGLSEARAELRDVTDQDTVEAAVETWHAEAARLMGERRAVGLVEEALRGRRFVARL